MRRWRIQGTVHSHPSTCIHVYSCLILNIPSLSPFSVLNCWSPDGYGSGEEAIDQDLS